MVDIWIYVETSSSPYLGVTLEFSTQKLKIVGIRAWSRTVASHKAHLAYDVVPGLLSSRGTSVGRISQNLWPWFSVVCNVCLVLWLQPFLCCLSSPSLGEGSRLPPCLGSPFLCLAEPFSSFLFVLTACLQGRDCLLSPHWETLSFAQVCGNSIRKITPEEALFMSLLRFALSSQKCCQR